jgi:hypothetical protein
MFPKTTEWTTLHAQTMKEMVDRINAATDVLLDCILHAADRIRYSQRRRRIEQNGI